MAGRIGDGAPVWQPEEEGLGEGDFDFEDTAILAGLELGIGAPDPEMAELMSALSAESLPQEPLSREGDLMGRVSLPMEELPIVPDQLEDIAASLFGENSDEVDAAVPLFGDSDIEDLAASLFGDSDVDVAESLLGDESNIEDITVVSFDDDLPGPALPGKEVVDIADTFELELVAKNLFSQVDVVTDSDDPILEAWLGSSDSEVVQIESLGDFGQAVIFVPGKVCVSEEVGCDVGQLETILEAYKEYAVEHGLPLDVPPTLTLVSKTVFDSFVHRVAQLLDSRAMSQDPATIRTDDESIVGWQSRWRSSKRPMDRVDSRVRRSRTDRGSKDARGLHDSPNSPRQLKDEIEKGVVASYETKRRERKKGEALTERKRRDAKDELDKSTRRRSSE